MMEAFVADNSRYVVAHLDGNRLIDHALLIGVVTHFNVTDHGEIFPERITDEAVVSQDAAQVGMIFKHDSIEVERLTLKPVSPRPDINNSRHHRKVFIVHKYFQAYTMIEAD